MPEHDPRIVIIVLNWNGRDDSEACLASLEDVTYDNMKTLLVDNGSHDDSVSYLSGKFPEVEFVLNERNLGFAEGNNVGIRRALETDAEWVLLLNNDTTVEPDFLTKLIDAAADDEKIGIIGPQINRYNPKDRVWFAGGHVCLWLGWSWHTGNHATDRGQFSGLVDEDYQTGAAMMLRREMLKAVGELDADYVSYFEDSDLCRRAKAADWRVVCCCDAKIYHKVSGSTGGGLTPHKAYRKIQSGARFYRRYAGRFRYYTTIAAFNFAYAAATVVIEIFRGRFNVVGAIFRGFADLFRGRDRDLMKTES